MRMLIAANWKMNGTVDWTNKPRTFNALVPANKRADIDVLICPPAYLLELMGTAAKDNHIHIGAQNCHAESSGAFTGEISADMIRDAGGDYVIVGHSERRAMGESNHDVAAKAKAALTAGITPIICVGETLEQRQAGHAKDVIADQLSESLPDIKGDIVIAYEPIWAIGTGLTASTGDIKDMHDFIRAKTSPATRILYGGSVKPGNAADILGTQNVNGALIGGASLEMESLAEIAKAAIGK